MKMQGKVGAGLIVGLVGIISGCQERFEKIDPEVIWETPADIGVGVPLGPEQLNAVADVDGTYTYTPGEGTVLEEGNAQTLSVEFAPKYPTAFNTINLSVAINVIDLGSSEALFNESVTYGTMADGDGHAYKTVTIGEQTWMAENLRTTHYRNGEAIDQVTDNGTWVGLSTGAYASYNHTEDLDEQATYGLLYNWYAVSDTRNLAPEGWHVATQADWDALIAEVGGVGNAGVMLKEAGNGHWNAGATATNGSGFTALPAGRRQYTDGTFINQGFNGFWWSATPNGADFAFYYQLNFDGNAIVPANFVKTAGYAVRCVKD